MACDNLCGFKENGWHDTACPESDDSISRDDRETIETLNAALLAALENCVLELRQYHTHYNPKCEGGCPALVCIEEAETAIKKAKGGN